MSEDQNIVTEGQLIGDFEGFDENMTFKFTNGQVWQQAHYKYVYHYAYMPRAKVVETANGNEIVIEGMHDTAVVRRVE